MGIKPIAPKAKGTKGFSPYLPKPKKTALKIAQVMLKPDKLKPLMKG